MLPRHIRAVRQEGTLRGSTPETQKESEAGPGLMHGPSFLSACSSWTFWIARSTSQTAYVFRDLPPQRGDALWYARPALRWAHEDTLRDPSARSYPADS